MSYSTKAELYLQIGGKRYRGSHLKPGEIELPWMPGLPLTPWAQIIVVIDGQETVHEVRIGALSGEEEGGVMRVRFTPDVA